MNMPIRHIVLCKFRPEVSESAQREIIEKVEALGALEGIRFSHFSSGPNVSPENLSYGLQLGFSMDFANAADRDAYLEHPEHRKVGAEIVALLESGTDSICVFDMALG
jgi:hypothetical protein